MSDEDRERRNERIKHLFAILDTKKEGKLYSIDDLRAGLKKLNHPLESADTLLQEVFDHIDSGNEYVTLVPY